MTHDRALKGTSMSILEPKMVVKQVRFEHHSEALGIGTAQPRISWLTETDQPRWTQAAYEIEAFSPAGERLGSTGRVESGQSVLVDWPFQPLASRQQVLLRVRVWGADGVVSAWSESAPVEAGLLNPEDWSAEYITPDWAFDPAVPQPSPLLRHEFNLEKPVQQARLYITALGLYEAYLNGQKVGDQVFAPGWTSYHHRLAYQTYDVTGLLQPGPNAIGAILGEGWYSGRLGYGGGRRNIFGERLALLAQLEITYSDGSTQQIVSDGTWRAATGPILSSEIYDGEVYDARLERLGWSEPGNPAENWSGVRPVDHPKTSLVAPAGPPVRRIETIRPIAILTSPSGKTLLDFGQNLVGRLRITVSGAAGQAITLRHAEVLENGELSLRPLRHAKATDTYILKGNGVETWEPLFTFHGFRYAEVDGWPGQLSLDDIQAVVIHSDMERTGWFECSDPLINRLHENVVWSMRGNFLAIPTDCPQRDERLGWTGDIQVFSPTATFLYDCAGFLSAWLADLAVEQAEFGCVPYFVPNISGSSNPPAAAWGDAAVVVPWVLYQRFGDLAILARQFESMRAWVDLIEQVAGETRLWDTGLQFGDWLDPAAPPDKPGDARTPNEIVATAYFALSAELVGQAARLLGRKAEETHYLGLARDVRAAFNAQYVTPAGRILGDSATAYSLALQFALLPDEAQRQRAGQRLADLVHANRYRVSTGFVGTPLICDALCSVGDAAAAYRLLMARENPSWLYPVSMGATTIWERWDSLLPDGSVNPGEMTSFNHYSLGAVADWLHRRVAGLAPAGPGYHAFSIHPIPGGGLTHASARHLTPYGLAESTWRIAGGQFHLDVNLPPNTSGTVILPGQVASEPVEIGSGHYHWSVPYTEMSKPRVPLSLDMTLGQLIDYPDTLNQILHILRAHNYELTTRLEVQTRLTLRQVAELTQDPKMILTRIAEVINSSKQ